MTIKTNLNLFICLICSCVFFASPVFAGSYAPQAGEEGSTAIRFNRSDIFVDWATGCEVVRGPVDISDPGQGYASYGTADQALGISGNNVYGVVSLGDGGYATLTFDAPIINGEGYDFAVFENGFTIQENPDVDPEWWNTDFLELAFVEVSSDGENFFRFDAVSETQTDHQVQGIDATEIHNFASKYTLGWGTPFDLEELVGISGLDLNDITHVRVMDVVGSLDDAYAGYDSLGNKINDPWRTAGWTGGFDLDAIGVINQAPIPGAVWLLGSGLIALAGLRRRYKT